MVESLIRSSRDSPVGVGCTFDGRRRDERVPTRPLREDSMQIQFEPGTHSYSVDARIRVDGDGAIGNRHWKDQKQRRIALPLSVSASAASFSSSLWSRGASAPPGERRLYRVRTV